jgi:hypothetical protein
MIWRAENKDSEAPISLRGTPKEQSGKYYIVFCSLLFGNAGRMSRIGIVEDKEQAETDSGSLSFTQHCVTFQYVLSGTLYIKLVPSCIIIAKVMASDGESIPDAVSLRVLIVGSGIAGLTAAVALRQQGHQVDVCESHPRMLSRC